jgi:hypothetical protein
MLPEPSNNHSCCNNGDARYIKRKLRLSRFFLTGASQDIIKALLKQNDVEANHIAGFMSVSCTLVCPFDFYKLPRYARSLSQSHPTQKDPPKNQPTKKDRTYIVGRPRTSFATLQNKVYKLASLFHFHEKKTYQPPPRIAIASELQH